MISILILGSLDHVADVSPGEEETNAQSVHVRQQNLNLNIVSIQQDSVRYCIHSPLISCGGFSRALVLWNASGEQG